MKRWIIYAAALALGISFCAWTAADAAGRRAGKRTQSAFVDENGDGIDDNATLRHRFGRGHHASHWFAEQLTEEQRTALKEKVDALKAEDATRDEIHAAVGEMLTGFGIELPENWGEMRGFGWSRDVVWTGAQLTEEQQTALKEKVDALKTEGATRDEIHAAVGEMLTGFGIALPEDGTWSLGFGRRGGAAGGVVWIGAQLTEEQQTALKEKIDALRTEGATRDEILAAARETLVGLGLELTDEDLLKLGMGGHHRGMRGHRFGRHGGWKGGPAGDAGSGDATTQ